MNFPEQSPIPLTDRAIQLGVIPMGLATDGRWGLSTCQALPGKPGDTVPSPFRRTTARLDVTGVDDAEAGDEVVIIGRQGDDEITLAEVARRHNIGVHQVATTIGPRVARIYRRSG